MAKVLSIEIARHLTEIAELDQKSRNPRVYQNFVISTPKYVFDEGMLVEYDDFADDVRNLIDSRKIKTKKVIFSVSSSRIATREVEIPYVKPNQIMQIIQANASDYFPVDISEYVLGHSILETLTRDEQKLYRLFVMAMPRDMVANYRDFAKACGLDLVGIDYDGNSLLRAVEKECKVGNQAVVKINEENTLVIMMQNGVQVLSRMIPYGMDEAVDAVMNSGRVGENTDYVDAVSFLRARNLVKSSLSATPGEGYYSQGAGSEESVEQMVTDSFENLIGGISTVMNLYNARYSDKPIDRMVLTGVGGTVLGLLELLQGSYNVRVESLHGLEGFHLDKKTTTKAGIIGEYIGCLGAVVKPVDFLGTSGKNALSLKGAKGAGLNRKAGIAVFLVCAVAAAAMVGISFLPYMQAKNENKELRAKINSLSPIVSVYQKYTLAKQSYEYMEQADALTQSPIGNDDHTLVDMLYEMEEKMPTEFRISTLSADDMGVYMTCKTDTKDEAAECILQFRTFECFGDVIVESFTHNLDDMGEPIDVDFSIEATWKVEEVVEEAPAPAEQEASDTEEMP